MKILLTNYLEVRADAHNYMPYKFKKVKPKDKESYYDWVSMDKYFNSLSSCVDWLIHNELKEGEVRLFTNYLSDYKNLLSQMESKFDKGAGGD